MLFSAYCCRYVLPVCLTLISSGLAMCTSSVCGASTAHPAACQPSAGGAVHLPAHLPSSRLQQTDHTPDQTVAQPEPHSVAGILLQIGCAAACKRLALHKHACAADRHTLECHAERGRVQCKHSATAAVRTQAGRWRLCCSPLPAGQPQASQARQLRGICSQCPVHGRASQVQACRKDSELQFSGLKGTGEVCFA